MIQTMASFIDNVRVGIYDHSMLVIQATGDSKDSGYVWKLIN